MSENIQVRRIPKKTFLLFGVIFILAGIIFGIRENTKTNKAVKILNSLGYKDISNVKVYTKKEFEDTNSRIQGYQYFVTFTNNTTSEDCRGFVLRDFKHKMDKDISCKKGK
jgi:hypothetical protein